MTAKAKEIYDQETVATLRTTTTSRLQPLYIPTTVSGRDETGVTILGEDGTGTFFPDSGTLSNVVPLKTGRSLSESQTNAAALSSYRISVESLYPQWEESSEGPGEAIRLLRDATNELQSACDSLCSSELEILNSLVIADGLLFQAIKYSSFNKSFEIALNFCAWAIRNAQGADRERPPLQGMCAALHELQDKPFIDANRVTDLVINLEDQGWDGSSPVSVAFEMALADDWLDLGD